MATGLVLLLAGVWLFVRTWWGHLPRQVVKSALPGMWEKIA